MKKILAFVFAVFLVISLVACNSVSNPVDITNDAVGQVEGGKMSLSSYSGNEKNIKIPDYMEGVPVSSIEQSFAEGKAFESVVLPERIQGCYRDENGKLVLTTWSDDGVVPINEKTAPWIYCSFFGVSSIQVNGEKYSCDTGNAVTDAMIVAEWTDGETVYVLDADYTLTIHAGDDQLEGTWQRQDSQITMHMDADFDDNELVMEYCGGCLVSWDYCAVLYQGDVPAEPEQSGGSDNGNLSSDEIVSGDFTYMDTDFGVIILSYNGTDSVVDIPDTLDGKTVTGLQMNCHDAIHELYIPDTVNARLNEQARMVNYIYSTQGLEIVHWSGLDDPWAINNLIDQGRGGQGMSNSGGAGDSSIKELYLPGLQSINLDEIPSCIWSTLEILDISDCQEVVGLRGSAGSDKLAVYVSEDICYVSEDEYDIVTLSASGGNGATAITDETWAGAWNLLFTCTSLKINDVECAGAEFDGDDNAESKLPLEETLADGSRVVREYDGIGHLVSEKLYNSQGVLIRETYYYESGNVRKQCIFGVDPVEWYLTEVTYYESGQMSSLVYYYDATNMATLKNWYENGQVWQSAEYGEDGSLLSYVSYDESGNIVESVG